MQPHMHGSGSVNNSSDRHDSGNEQREKDEKATKRSLTVTPTPLISSVSLSLSSLPTSSTTPSDDAEPIPKATNKSQRRHHEDHDSMRSSSMNDKVKRARPPPPPPPPSPPPRRHQSPSNNVTQTSSTSSNKAIKPPAPTPTTTRSKRARDSIITNNHTDDDDESESDDNTENKDRNVCIVCVRACVRVGHHSNFGILLLPHF
jgi:hypothetical protein